MDSHISTILSDAEGGHRISEADALALFTTRGRDVWKITTAADEKREKVAGDAVTYVRNQNINVTNICVNACGFCGFSKKLGDEGCYFHDETVIREKAALAKSRNVTEICTVSGLHPAFTAQSYIDVYRWISEAAPGVHLHASNPMEVAYAARRSRMTTEEVLSQMKAAGLNSMCGTAAEILVDPSGRRSARRRSPPASGCASSARPTTSASPRQRRSCTATARAILTGCGTLPSSVRSRMKPTALRSSSLSRSST